MKKVIQSASLLLATALIALPTSHAEAISSAPPLMSEGNVSHRVQLVEATIMNIDRSLKQASQILGLFGNSFGEEIPSDLATLRDQFGLTLRSIQSAGMNPTRLDELDALNARAAEVWKKIAQPSEERLQSMEPRIIELSQHRRMPEQDGTQQEKWGDLLLSLHPELDLRSPINADCRIAIRRFVESQPATNEIPGSSGTLRALFNLQDNSQERAGPSSRPLRASSQSSQDDR